MLRLVFPFNFYSCDPHYYESDAYRCDQLLNRRKDGTSMHWVTVGISYLTLHASSSENICHDKTGKLSGACTCTDISISHRCIYRMDHTRMLSVRNCLQTDATTAESFGRRQNYKFISNLKKTMVWVVPMATEQDSTTAKYHHLTPSHGCLCVHIYKPAASNLWDVKYWMAKLQGACMIWLTVWASRDPGHQEDSILSEPLLLSYL